MMAPGRAGDRRRPYASSGGHGLASAWSRRAAAEIEVVAKGARFPEGPLWADGALYFVEYGGHTILRVGADGVLTTIWERPGCGPAALVQAGPDFLVTCYDENTLVRVSPAGETLQVYDKDAAGAAFIGPNDFVADDAGGVFMSASGPWETAPIVGKILYRAPDGTLRTVADDLHYANGLALSPDGQDALLLGDVRLSDRRLRRRRGRQPHQPPRVRPRRRHRRRRPAAGPDGLKTDAKGNLYIALYEGGQVLVADPTRASCWRPSIRRRPTSRTSAFGPDDERALRHRRARRCRRTLAGRGLPDRQSDRSLKSALSG